MSGTDPKFSDCIKELQNYTMLSMAAICKLHAQENRLSSGMFECPLCRAGVVIYSISRSNGHVRASCDRVCNDGTRCFSFVE